MAIMLHNSVCFLVVNVDHIVHLYHGLLKLPLFGTLFSVMNHKDSI
jgi:hypothetical protein